jgi:hypothetical protein
MLVFRRMGVENPSTLLEAFDEPRMNPFQDLSFTFGR